ncbi:Mov34/MPN/PAD-1 family protein [Idiomarina sp. OXR-189]|uniref:Mov34/MPN/PAD-1 family protein n=1 Tax=Idiomarina sp. OXR-189 TaxID=3100175 RepID=UPI002AC983EC|nr:Mov34/MPN/PAD-1 family protein [Idiomarina sp. OXR-189]WPZ01530.1 Mov34/MPN/PAD-1 family protein [Idiomarina sp. OXR-189]
MQSSVTEDTSLFYQTPDRKIIIEFPSDVLMHLTRYRQNRCYSKEAGGQLFGKFNVEGHITIGAITGPRKTDKRSRHSYKADHAQEQREIDEKYKDGLYFLGDWHTHPEGVATPSPSDIKAITEIYQSSIEPGPGFLLVIAGTAPIQDSLSVSWCNSKVTTMQRVDFPAFTR